MVSTLDRTHTPYTILHLKCPISLLVHYHFIIQRFQKDFKSYENTIHHLFSLVGIRVEEAKNDYIILCLQYVYVGSG